VNAREQLHARISALIARLADGSRDDDARDALLLELGRYQIAHVAPYERFAAQRLRGVEPRDVTELPALPTDAFRFARISSRAESEDVRRFQSSGTTSETRSTHALQDLTLYAQAAQVAARHALFCDRQKLRLIVLAPSELELPDSSLSYMLTRFIDWFASSAETIWPLGPEELARLRTTLRAAEQRGEPVAMLGTSFAFVHALDALGTERFSLPSHSRIMQTGGFKGRSREVQPEEMRTLLSAAFGIASEYIVAEYGMTELSSQLYENTLRDALHGRSAPRRLWWPGWVRVSVVDPETLAELPEGEEGLVRIDDLANLDSVAAIQTADLGVIDQHGLTLHGRASAAVARGCSIRADELLGAPR
jgi:hypothetical protein